MTWSCAADVVGLGTKISRAIGGRKKNAMRKGILPLPAGCGGRPIDTRTTRDTASAASMTAAATMSICWSDIGHVLSRGERMAGVDGSGARSQDRTGEAPAVAGCSEPRQSASVNCSVIQPL